GGVGGSVSVVPSAGNTYTITFGGNFANLDQPLLKLTPSTNLVATLTTGNEVQRVTVKEITGASFRLSFNGKSTPLGLLSADPTSPATAAEVQAALEALTTIGLGNVSVTDNAVTSGLPGQLDTFHVYTITFKGALAGQDQPTITALGANGTTANASVVSDG